MSNMATGGACDKAAVCISHALPELRLLHMSARIRSAIPQHQVRTLLAGRRRIPAASALTSWCTSLTCGRRRVTQSSKTRARVYSTGRLPDNRNIDILSGAQTPAENACRINSQKRMWALGRRRKEPRNELYCIYPLHPLVQPNPDIIKQTLRLRGERQLGHKRRFLDNALEFRTNAQARSNCCCKGKQIRTTMRCTRQAKIQLTPQNIQPKQRHRKPNNLPPTPNLNKLRDQTHTNHNAAKNPKELRRIVRRLVACFVRRPQGEYQHYFDGGEDEEDDERHEGGRLPCSARAVVLALTDYRV
ncbi:hypothetical protein R3P38DRAFT_3364101 [Favolaschia claudopus]|uniref:Uncharacterized protein n=1 Tax=Favolaschia claudopus TaxID=2862362 RepID=A0AAW0AJQ2_9AGAR